ncbi:hypothetical protein [Arcobacter sp. LA11]|uniref:hypothetical protein n=1 Tax=Arcobacter sp. LA11 TaxID=1898176 RepID=UPI000932A5E2|nr:hypothetical protein [Arcobacter sp. LA11]
MMLINVHNIFRDAVLEENADTLEKILSSSDTRIDLIEDFSKHHDINMLISIIPKFKSKGLISNIQEYCDLILSRNKKKYISSDFESSVIKYVHQRNMEENKIKHLQDDAFEKKRVS